MPASPEEFSGLKMPQRQPKCATLWLADASCVRPQPERANLVSAHDFVEDRTREGRKFAMVCVGDEFTREALATRVARKLSSSGLIDVLADPFISRGVPAHIHSDHGPASVAEAVNGLIEGVGARTAYIEKASPRESGYVEAFDGKLLEGKVSNTLREAQAMIEGRRRHSSRVRPHSPLGCRPPDPEMMPMARSQIRSGAGAAAMAH
jgi:transposase InsO family protein